jgi:hypothetical protein
MRKKIQYYVFIITLTWSKNNRHIDMNLEMALSLD